MQWTSKSSVVTKRKAYNIVSANPGLQNDAKNFSSVSEAFHLFIGKKKWWKNSALIRMRKRKPFSVVQVINIKLEGYYTQRTVCILGVLIAAGRNNGKRLHLEEVWTSNKLFAQPFFYSSNVKEQVQINLSIRKL